MIRRDGVDFRFEMNRSTALPEDVFDASKADNAYPEPIGTQARRLSLQEAIKMGQAAQDLVFSQVKDTVLNQEKVGV